MKTKKRRTLQCQFDIYQRFSFLGLIISVFADSLNKDHLKILDFGCGSEDLISVFTRSSRSSMWGSLDITRVDVQNFGDSTIKVIGEKGDLPFSDGEFDVVVSMDVLEHIKSKEHRTQAIRETCRVARHGVIHATPKKCHEVMLAEAKVRLVYEKVFRTKNQFLVEHLESGLVDESEIVPFMLQRNFVATIFPNAVLGLWKKYMFLDYVLSSQPETLELVPTLNEIINTNVHFYYDDQPSYRNFYVGCAPHLSQKIFDKIRERKIDQVPTNLFIPWVDQIFNEL